MTSIAARDGSDGAPRSGDRLEAGVSGRTYGRLLGFFRRRLPQTGIDSAEDLCQETMLAAWLGAVNGSQVVRSPGRYLRGIAVRKLCDRLRWEYRRPAMTCEPIDLRPGQEPPGEDDPELRLMAAESRAALVRALNHLPAPESRLLRLCLFEGCTHGEACRRIGISNEDGSRVKYRAVRRLREALSPISDDAGVGVRGRGRLARRRGDRVTLSALLFPNNQSRDV